MKKLIQICSVLSLLVVFSVVSANAQAFVKRYQAQIPFDFNIGQKAYQAGNYVIKISKFSSEGIALSLEDTKSHRLQTVLLPKNGDVSADAPKLIFTRYENQRFLSKLLTEEIGVSLIKSDVEKRIAEKDKQVVTIAANR